MKSQSFAFFKGIDTLEALKAEYKSLAKLHHPDKGGDVEVMKQINVAYEAAFKALSGGTFQTQKEADFAWECEEVYMQKIQALASLEGIVIELCGSWIWITGNTQPVKDSIKAAGFFWAKIKKAWYWRPAEFSGGSRHSQATLGEIRAKHGSKVVTPKTAYKLT